MKLQWSYCKHFYSNLLASNLQQIFTVMKVISAYLLWLGTA